MDDQFNNNRPRRCRSDNDECEHQSNHHRSDNDICEQAECIKEIICSEAEVAECQARLFCDVTNRLRCEIKHARCLKELERLICITNRFLEASAKKEKAIGEVACDCNKSDKDCHD